MAILKVQLELEQMTRYLLCVALVLVSALRIFKRDPQSFCLRGSVVGVDTCLSRHAHKSALFHCKLLRTGNLKTIDGIIQTRTLTANQGPISVYNPNSATLHIES